MRAMSRRQVLSASCAAALSGAAGAASAATNGEPQRSFNLPDFTDIVKRMSDVRQRGASLSLEERFAALLSALTAHGDGASSAAVCDQALQAGLSPAYLEEVMLQTAPYAGVGRVAAVLEAVHALFASRGIALPLQSRRTVPDETRLSEGISVQTEIFGDAIGRMHASVQDSRRPLMIEDLSGFCFGDFYTRKGLDVKTRELVVFSAIAALGGCEAQLKVHAAANLKYGRTKDNLVDALQCAVAYNGFPRTLNACAVVDAL